MKIEIIIIIISKIALIIIVQNSVNFNNFIKIFESCFTRKICKKDNWLYKTNLKELIKIIRNIKIE